MKKLNIIFAIMLVAALTTLSTTRAYSQNSNPPVLQADDDEDVNALPPDDGDPVDTPIDGGLSLLIAAGVGMGVKKVKDTRKKK